MVIYQNMFYSPREKDRMLHIWLPDDYEKSDDRYAVMYMFDGHNLFFDEKATYGKSWGLKSFLEKFEKPMIVIGMECGHEGNERLIEYSPYHITGRWWGDIPGCGDATFRWIENEVKPWADSTLRTYSFREATGIGGSSMGGLMAVYGAAKFNHIFSKAACLSSAVHPVMKELTRDIAASDIDPNTRIYLSWGECEAARGIDRKVDPIATRAAQYNYILDGMFRQKNCTTQVFLQPGGNHCEADWEKQVPGFMRFLWEA